MKIKAMLFIAMTLIGLTSAAFATSFTFSDQNYFNGQSWGTMMVDIENVTTLKVQFNFNPAFGSSIPGAEATGFGFAFIPNTVVPSEILNPAGDAFSDDQDALNWTKLTNLNSIPNPENGDEFTPEVKKGDFFSGATEGNANNINPPGIAIGQNDLFYLTFAGQNFTLQSFNLSNFINNVGVRIQSLPNSVNGGSIYLVGTKDTNSGNHLVPEPTTLLLLGSGIIGIGLFLRKRNN